MYHPQAYFVMFVSGEVIMYHVEWLHYEEAGTDFSAQKTHSDGFMESCFLSWDYIDEGV
jgi:hypothetical protein